MMLEVCPVTAALVYDAAIISASEPLADSNSESAKNLVREITDEICRDISFSTM